jgi:hypothetical protein
MTLQRLTSQLLELGFLNKLGYIYQIPALARAMVAHHDPSISKKLESGGSLDYELSGLTEK